MPWTVGQGRTFFRFPVNCRPWEDTSPMSPSVLPPPTGPGAGRAATAPDGLVCVRASTTTKEGPIHERQNSPVFPGSGSGSHRCRRLRPGHRRGVPEPIPCCPGPGTPHPTLVRSSRRGHRLSAVLTAAPLGGALEDERFARVLVGPGLSSPQRGLCPLGRALPLVPRRESPHFLSPARRP